MILVISSKKVYAAKRLEAEARIKNIELRIMDVEDLAASDFKVDLKKFDVLYVRDPYFKGSAKYIPQIIKLARQFKRAGKRVIDSVIANGELGQGKWTDYQKLMKAGILIPKTSVIARRSASDDEAIPSNNRLLRSSAALGTRNYNVTYPLILKWTYGFKAKNVFLVKTPDQLKKILPLHPKNEWLVQEFIKADYEYKVITIGYKALPVILRFNISNGGFGVDFDKYEVIKIPTTSPPPGRGYSSLDKEERLRTCSDDADNRGLSAEALAKAEASPPCRGGEAALADGVVHPEPEFDDWLRVGADKIKKIIQFAEQSSFVLKRELAKVDILESQGKFYILEVNRFPGLKSFEELTKYKVFMEFLRYLQKPGFKI